jgi:hypothetical protein
VRWGFQFKRLGYISKLSYHPFRRKIVAMARLPVPGADKGSWGNILNDFLNTAHNDDGTLKSGSVGDGQVSSISQSKVTNLTSDLAAKASTALTYTTVARVFYNTGTSSYPTRPAGFTSVEWVGPVAPTIGGSYAADGYDTWINTA